MVPPGFEPHSLRSFVLSAVEVCRLPDLKNARLASRFPARCARGDRGQLEYATIRVSACVSESTNDERNARTSLAH